MSDERFKESVEYVGKLIDLAGVAVIAGGIVVATVVFVVHLRGSSEGPEGAYRRYRQGIGRAIFSVSSSWLPQTSFARSR